MIDGSGKSVKEVFIGYGRGRVCRDDEGDGEVVVADKAFGELGHRNEVAHAGAREEGEVDSHFLEKIT